MSPQLLAFYLIEKQFRWITTLTFKSSGRCESGRPGEIGCFAGSFHVSPYCSLRDGTYSIDFTLFFGFSFSTTQFCQSGGGRHSFPRDFFLQLTLSHLIPADWIRFDRSHTAGFQGKIWRTTRVRRLFRVPWWFVIKKKILPYKLRILILQETHHHRRRFHHRHRHRLQHITER